MPTSSVGTPDLQDGLHYLLRTVRVQDATIYADDSSNRLQHESKRLFCGLCKIGTEIADDSQ